MTMFTYEEIDELGDGLMRSYLGDKAGSVLRADIEGFTENYLRLPVEYQSFSGNDLDKLGFISDGITPLEINCNGKTVQQIFPKGTIVIEKALCHENESGRRRFTLSHESAHFILDKTLSQAKFHREFDSERGYSPDELKDLFDIRETQVDRMGAALLMPRFMVENVLESEGIDSRIQMFGNGILQAEDKLKVKRMACRMGVSFTSFLIRLRELKLIEYRPLNEYIAGMGINV